MKRSKLYELVEVALSTNELEEAICEVLADYIDYEAVAKELLEDIQDDIHSAAVSVARELMDCPPF